MGTKQMTNTAENTGISEGVDIAELHNKLARAVLERNEADNARAAAVANLADMQRNQDRLAEALMIVLGDPIDALIESRIESALPDRFSDLLMEGFDIYEHQSEIEHMIDERLDDRVGEPESEEDRHAAVEEIVKDVISGASISIDI
tara:strand:+ start:427 stop:867 length:441 start_codon:yes stop_codon:yes gene_type:complete